MPATGQPRLLLERDLARVGWLQRRERWRSVDSVALAEAQAAGRVGKGSRGAARGKERQPPPASTPTVAPQPPLENGGGKFDPAPFELHKWGWPAIQTWLAGLGCSEDHSEALLLVGIADANALLALTALSITTQITAKFKKSWNWRHPALGAKSD